VSEETLLSAARRVVRFFNIDATSGLISVETQQSIDTLDKMVRLEQRKIDEQTEEGATQ